MFSAEFPWLTAVIALPLIGAFAIPLIPDKYGKKILEIIV